MLLSCLWKSDQRDREPGGSKLAFGVFRPPFPYFPAVRVRSHKTLSLLSALTCGSTLHLISRDAGEWEAARVPPLVIGWLFGYWPFSMVT